MKKILFLVAAVAMIAVGNTAQAKKNIGLATYSVKGIQSDPDRAFKAIADMGYTTVEIANYNAANGTIFDKTPADFKKYLKNYGLTVSSSHTSAGLNTEDEAGTLQKWETIFKNHKEMGCRYVVLPMNMQWGNEAKMKQITELMNKIGALAKKYNITFAYHNHNGEFLPYEGGTTFIEDYLIQNTDPKLVSFELDVYWVTQGKQSPVEYLKKYPKRFKVLHIKDYYVVGASGKIDYEAIFKQFYANGFKDFYVEMENESTIEQADAQAARMMDGSMFRRPAGERPQQAAAPQEPRPTPPTPTEQLNKALKGIADSYDYLNKASFVK